MGSMAHNMPKRSQNSSEEKEQHESPRWRRIEIMREKAQLREALGEFGDEQDDIEEEVFGTDEEYASFHEHGGDSEEPDNPEEELAGFDDEVGSLDELEDFEED